MALARRRSSKGRAAGRSTKTRRPPRRRSARVSARASSWRHPWWCSAVRDVARARRSGELVEQPQVRLSEQGLLGGPGGRAAELDQTPPDRSVGVLDRVVGDQVVVEPRDEEEEALLVPRRVERQGIEPVVQSGESELEPGSGDAKALGDLGDVLNRAPHLSGERPDLVLDRPGRLPEERAQGPQRRSGCPRARQALLERGPGLQRELVRAGQ